MPDNDVRPASDGVDRPQAFARWCFAAGGLSIVLAAAVLLHPPRAPGAELSSFSAHRSSFEALGIVALVWAVFSIPCVVATGRLLRTTSAGFALAGTILSVVGIALFGFAIFAHVGSVLAILLTASTNPEFAKYEAEMWGTLWFFLTDPGLMTWGLGQFLFAWLSWGRDDVPRWISVVGLVGGTAGLLTLAIYQSALFFFIQLAGFAVWGFAIGGALRTRQQQPLRVGAR